MILKLKYSDKTLKVKFEGKTIAELRNIVKAKFNFEETKNFKLCYVDEEGDQIDLINDDDLSVSLTESMELSRTQDRATAMTIIINDGVNPTIDTEAQAEITNMLKDMTSHPKAAMVSGEKDEMHVKPQPMMVEPTTNTSAGGAINYPTEPAPAHPISKQQNMISVQNTGSALFGSAHAVAQESSNRGGLFSNATPGPAPITLPITISPTPTPIYVEPGHVIQQRSCLPRPVYTNDVHTGVSCNGCRVNPIRGRRYKSVTRYDFDLCSNCVNKAAYKNDMYLMIPKHDPYNPALNNTNFQQVLSYFNGFPKTYYPPVYVQPYPLPVPQPQPIYVVTNPYAPVHLIPLIRQAFPNDDGNRINTFVQSLGAMATYEDAYSQYVRKYH